MHSIVRRISELSDRVSDGWDLISATNDRKPFIAEMRSKPENNIGWFEKVLGARDNYAHPNKLGMEDGVGFAKTLVKLIFGVDDIFDELYKMNDSDRCCGPGRSPRLDRTGARKYWTGSEPSLISLARPVTPPSSACLTSRKWAIKKGASERFEVHAKNYAHPDKLRLEDGEWVSLRPL
ncbi:hypothetical protein RHMOL_Rhmol10G0063300 [Rhododendron molle]|uniref:Uncharacterized protein n=1 Tax=Rhododendron molle TaxID=49168 RepID=A0ACC0LZJ8_RHOML|nr:hypothetical protein RHMOL_Rhmol10G0063300 [Rhododendron molle]